MHNQSPTDVWPEDRLIGAPHAIPVGTTLFRQDDPIKTLYLIDDGVVKIFGSTYGNPDVLVALRTRGWLLGATGVLAGTVHAVSASTVTPCVIRQIHPRDFAVAGKENAKVRDWLYRMLARESIDHVERLKGFGGSGRDRLLCHFKELATLGSATLPNGDIRVLVNMGLEDTATAVNLTRQQVRRLLKRLGADGNLRRDKNGWWILVAGRNGPDP